MVKGESVSSGREPAGETYGPSRLGEGLEALKRRSGRSYAALAHRTGLSRSSLHRYCQGRTVPGTFGTVESIARACGADDQEVDRLYRAWRRAAASEEASTAVPEVGVEAPSPGTDQDTGTDSGTDSGASAAGDGEPPSADARVVRVRHTGHWLRAVTLLLALVVTSYTVTVPYLDARHTPYGRGTSGPPAAGEVAAGGQPLDGPDWSVRPRRVAPELFGLTLNTDTGRMPGFRTGSVRMWESETRWGSIERSRRHYDWSTADRTVNNARREGLPVLFTLSGTPLWAGGEDAHGSGYQDSLASPPQDLADWDHFVRKAVERYRGRVDSYELWDYPSHPLHYAGSLATLAEMVERASRIIRREDPSALVACPSFGRLWTAQGRQRLREFARTGAFGSCDAAALKLVPRKPTGPPEEIIELAGDVEDILYEEGVVDLALWNTGTDRDVAVAEPLDARRARDYAVRFYLAGLYSRDAGVRRMYFYSWGGTRVPLVVQPVGGRPTEAGRRMERLYGWLAGARISGCGKGRAMRLADGAYTCRFQRGGARFDVYWTSHGRAGLTLPKGAHRLRHMDGSTVRARAGERISFGEEPVLVERRAE
ncbi:hypothetical protein AN218_03740 [Streptomyces nanshensis]|uniref:HTH cro/C1-type domain-containing protein n=1 Tax=Streptomyces nanshensis TaxID=518642 RepID=A0A1E7LBM8_9ACTN|nr:hypothetical protein AN218_03740 [Streptomyces nanshensis]